MGRSNAKNGSWALACAFRAFSLASAKWGVRLRTRLASSLTTTPTYSDQGDMILFSTRWFIDYPEGFYNPYRLESSGDLLPPSPPAEKATARQDQAGKSRTGDGANIEADVVDIEAVFVH